MPLLCSLGFHKWRDYGKEVEIYWQEPTPMKAGLRYGIGSDNVGLRKSALDAHSKVVFERRECKRCGLKLRRKLITNEDGTQSSVGWELDTVKNNDE